MEIWFGIIVALCVAALIRSLLGFFRPLSAPKLPPGLPTIPVIGKFLVLRKSFSEIESMLRSLHAKHGPIVTLQMWSGPNIFISSRSLAHQALIQHGAIYADRPPAIPTAKITSCNQNNISAGFYGPTWRTLRRNLIAKLLHPASIRSFSPARKWVLGIMLDRLKTSELGEKAVQPVDHFRYGMFCLLVLMCFGDRLEEHKIKDVEAVERALLLRGRRFRILNLWPTVGKFLFRGRWKEFDELRCNQENVLLPLIRGRSEARVKSKVDNIDSGTTQTDADPVMCYADTLLDLQLPDEGGYRKLTEAEIKAICSELLSGGTDTTTTALQWIMANIVKHPAIQEKLYQEIRAVVGPEADTVEESDLQNMPYLKAVILEGLRRHPPAHFVLPHAVTEDTELGNFMIPRNASVNFMVAEMGWDPAVWEDPMAFKPERFLSNGKNAEPFDITGTREIKMMPFGVGRRMCPGFTLALLHLEYFVSNLVLAFEWKAKDGDEIDLSEKMEFTIVMKNPLQAILSPRIKI